MGSKILPYSTLTSGGGHWVVATGCAPAPLDEGRRNENVCDGWGSSAAQGPPG